MKIFRFVVIGFFILFSLLNSPPSFGFETNSARGGYLGEFCWETEDGTILRLGFTHVGNGHYIVNGRTIEPGEVHALHGNAEIVGGQVITSVVSTGFDDYSTWNYVGTWVFSLSTRDGYVESIGHYYDKTTSQFEVIQKGETITSIPCP